MSDLQKTLELEMRLAAIEKVVTHLQATMMVGTGVDLTEIEAMIDQGREIAGQQTFPNLHPAQSDLASAAWQDAIVRLSDMTKEAARDLTEHLRK